jgi:hypothetical protein
MMTVVNEHTERLYRVIGIEGGYYFFGYLDTQLLGQGSVTVTTSFTDSTFKAITSLDPSVFPNVDALKAFLDLRVRYTDWAASVLSGKVESEFERDLEAESALNNFTTVQASPVQANDFNLDD